MKNKMKGVMGIGLALVLAFTLVSAALPGADAEAGVPLQWNRTFTPTIGPNFVLQPGTDLYDMAVSEDGETVYVVGALGPAPCGLGVNGTFEIDSSESTLTVDCWGGLCATLVSTGAESPTNGPGGLLGAFTYELDVSIIDSTAATITGRGVVTGNATDGYIMTMCGDLCTDGTRPCGDVAIDVTDPTITVTDGCITSEPLGSDFTINNGSMWVPKLWKSVNGGETWKDITANINGIPGAKNLPQLLSKFTNVSIAPDNDEFVMVAGYGCLVDCSGTPPWSCSCQGEVLVVGSNDGAVHFTYTSDMEDTVNDTRLFVIYDMDISPEVMGVHNVAVGGIGYNPALPCDTWYGTVYRLEAGAWLAANWQDTSFYPGWMPLDSVGTDTTSPSTNCLWYQDEVLWKPTAVTTVEFSPNFDIDRAIVTMGNSYDEGPNGLVEPSTFLTGDDVGMTYYLQTGSWEIGGMWNMADAGMAGPVQINDTGAPILGAYADIDATGIALPTDYDATLPPNAVVLVYVNGVNPNVGTGVGAWGGYVFRIDFVTLSPKCNPAGSPPLASIDYYGDSQSGKAMVGTLCEFVPCMGSMVYRTAELDVCCPKWYASCKPPTGYDHCPCDLQCFCVEGTDCLDLTGAACDEGDDCICAGGDCWYSGDVNNDDVYGDGGETAETLYAIHAIGVQHCLELCGEKGGHAQVTFTPDGEKAYAITVGCESAFSVSRDDGRSWNQIGLIDTVIDCLGDIQVTPDCLKAYITSTNHDWCGCSCLCEDTGTYCGASCDSVWRSEVDDTHPEIGLYWERVLTEEFADSCCCQDCVGESTYVLASVEDPGILRLPYGEEHPEAVYLGDFGGNNMWYSLDQGQCWTKTPTTKVPIQDFALEDEATVYVLSAAGIVSVSTSYGRHWTPGTDTKLGSGHTIAVMPEGNVLVGAVAGPNEVAYSDDGAVTFERTKPLPMVGKTHVAWAPLCEDIIFAAVGDPVTGTGGIYRLELGGSPDWKDLNAAPYFYTGIVLGASDGTLYASYKYWTCPCDELPGPCDPGVDWYQVGPCECMDVGSFHVGVARNLDPCETACCDEEIWDYLEAGLDACSGFTCEPSALRICGCLTADSDSVLWAIDCCGCMGEYSGGECTMDSASCADPWGYDMVKGLTGNVWNYIDCVAKKGPTLVAPEDGAILACDPCACHAAPLTLEWTRLCNACSYDVMIFDENHNVIRVFNHVTPPPGQGESPSMYIGSANITEEIHERGWLTQCGSTYYWWVRVSDAETGEYIKSPFSEQWSFTIEAGMTGGIELVAPEYDATDVMLTGIAFSWTGIPNADTYEMVLSANADLSSPLAEVETTGTSYAYTGTLDYRTSYYWQVLGLRDGVVIDSSPVGVFTTEAEPEEAPPPPEEEEPIWPPYAWAIIAIGTALMVVVIVLIFRTRRVS